MFCKHPLRTKGLAPHSNIHEELGKAFFKKGHGRLRCLLLLAKKTDKKDIPNGYIGLLDWLKENAHKNYGKKTRTSAAPYAIMIETLQHCPDKAGFIFAELLLNFIDNELLPYLYSISSKDKALDKYLRQKSEIFFELCDQYIENCRLSERNKHAD